MNPVIESLTGMKAFNDQFITADLIQDIQIRIRLLSEGLQNSPSQTLHPDLAEQLQDALQFQEELYQYCSQKEWILADNTMQWDQDLRWARKAIKMI